MPPSSDSPAPSRRSSVLEVSARRRRLWEVHATYELSERDLALAEAARLEKRPGVEGTKVSKEVWHSGSLRPESTVIYRSQALQDEMVAFAEERARERAARNAAMQQRKAGQQAAAIQHEQLVREVRLGEALPWVLGSFVAACMFGAALTVLASTGMQQLPSVGVSIDRHSQSGILVAVFVFFTGYPFIVALRRILRKASHERRVIVPAQQAHPRSPAPMWRGSPSSSRPAASTGNSDAGPDAPGLQRGVVLSADQAEVSGEPSPPQTGDPAQKMQRLEETLRGELAAREGELDSSQRLALNIFVAGAIARVAKDSSLDAAAIRTLLAGTLIRLGTPPKQAADFVAMLEEYLARPRALPIFNAGGSAVQRIEKEKGLEGVLARMLALWDTPQEPAEGVSPALRAEVAAEENVSGPEPEPATTADAEPDTEFETEIAAGPPPADIFVLAVECQEHVAEPQDGEVKTTPAPSGDVAAPIDGEVANETGQLFLTAMSELVRRSGGGRVALSGDRFTALFRTSSEAFDSVFALYQSLSGEESGEGAESGEGPAIPPQLGRWRAALAAGTVPAGQADSVVEAAHRLLVRAVPGQLLADSGLLERFTDTRFTLNLLEASGEEDEALPRAYEMRALLSEPAEPAPEAPEPDVDPEADIPEFERFHEGLAVPGGSAAS